MAVIQTPAQYTRDVDWINAVNSYRADPTGTNDSTTALQNALNAAASNGGGNVYLPVGTYKISSPLNLKTGVTLRGAGIDAVTIKQYSSTAHGLEGTDLSYVGVRDLTLSGPAAGSGNGINLIRSANANIPYCNFVNVQAATFGNCGFFGDVFIVSRFAGCIARSNGGDGFQLDSSSGNTTSVSLESCYANANASAGYELDSAVYCALAGCASDGNNIGYALYGAQACSIAGSGTESSTTIGLLLSGGIGNAVNGLWVNVNKEYGVHITAGETDATLSGLVENSASGATNFILTDTGTSSVIINPKNITANSFATGTAYTINSAGGTTH